MNFSRTENCRQTYSQHACSITHVFVLNFVMLQLQCINDHIRNNYCISQFAIDLRMQCNYQINIPGEFGTDIEILLHTATKVYT